MRKRIISALTIMLSLCLLLSACSGGTGTSPGGEPTQSPTANAQSGSKVTAPGVFPVYEGDPVTLRIFNNAEESILISDFSYDKNDFTKFICDKPGVNIEWIEARSNALEKLNLLLASNDLPDIVFSTMSPEMQLTYGSQGILMPVEDLLLENMYYFKDVLEADPELLNKYRMADGNVYCVPKTMGAYEIAYEQFCMINKTWLDNLGLSMPETVDDLRNVLQAFKDQDPNGNGKADEIPFLGYKDAESPGEAWAFLMFPFIYHDGQYSTLINKSGSEAFPAFTQEEWKAGLKYQNELFKAGLLDPESFTIDRTQARQLMVQDDALVGVIATKAPHHVMDPSSDRIHDYVYLPPLKGPDGEARHMYNPDIPKIGDTYFRVAITSACKEPEIAIRFLDAFYDPETSQSVQYGVKDVDWRYGKEGEVGINGEPAKWVPLNQVWGAEQTKAWDLAGPCWWPWEWRYGEIVKDPDKNYNGSYTMFNAAKNIYAPYADEDSHFPQNLNFMLDEVEEAVSLKTDIYSYVEQATAQFIIGERNLESDWDSYLKDLDRYGLDRWMELQLAAYERQYGEKLTYKK